MRRLCANPRETTNATLLGSFSERCRRMPQRILALGGHAHRPCCRGKRQDHGRLCRYESVVTMRLESEPALVVKRTVPPAALPPDCPGFKVTERFNLAAWTAPFCLSPDFVNEAGGLPTRIHPPCCCATPDVSVLGTL